MMFGAKGKSILQRRSWLWISLVCLLVTITACTVGTFETTVEPVGDEPLKWFGGYVNILQQSAEFYGGAEAARIAETVLAYQSANGGWPKNYDRIAERSADVLQQIYQAREARDDTTFDNGATHSEVQFLARMYQATGDERYNEAALNGIDFMLIAQFENGGWPQKYPGYTQSITFNDDAMIGVMTVLYDIARGDTLYAFVDGARREKAADAVEKGIAVILQTQIVVDGNLTAWCAQHDRHTLKPQTARSYEPPSISGLESVGIVRFLTRIEEPGPEVVAAIEGAVAWFESAKLTGIRVDRIEDASLEKGFDLVVVEDATAPPLWARFYDIDTNQAIFPDRDGSVYDSLNDLSYERRTGYNYLTDKPASLLYEEYPTWKQAQQPQANSTALYIVFAGCVVIGTVFVGFILWRRHRRQMP
ncbi:MAG: pectate lyase [Anaerolineae bacterium]|nr:pectate lyase [Anaerolineae bacterium]